MCQRERASVGGLRAVQGHARSWGRQWKPQTWLTNPQTNKQTKYEAESSLKSLVPQLVKQFPALDWTQRFITVTTTICHRVLLERLSSSASQAIPCSWLNPKVHYRHNNNLPLVPSLSQIKPVHAFPNGSFTIHLNIILPSKPTKKKKNYSQDIVTWSRLKLAT
jgi:hypothetical protein